MSLAQPTSVAAVSQQIDRGHQTTLKRRHDKTRVTRASHVAREVEVTSGLRELNRFRTVEASARSPWCQHAPFDVAGRKALETACTSAPLRARRFKRCDPMNPLAPVTRTVWPENRAESFIYFPVLSVSRSCTTSRFAAVFVTSKSNQDFSATSNSVWVPLA